jgi:alpha-mannosidase
MTAVSPKKVYIVSHTHWDREWYRPFHEFRVDLIGVVSTVLDRLENDDAFQHFLLDGQSIILEDYLEIVPGDESRIRALVKGGVLSVGPWYVLPDEFLVSAEAIVRNLILGHRVAGKIGPVQKVGYMPDSFGHIAQLPQGSTNTVAIATVASWGFMNRGTPAPSAP